MPMLRETMLKRLLLPIAAAGGGGSAPVEDTATGNPLVFFTDLARPLKSLLIPFTPQQEGTGDPSPENIRSILPWNGLKVWYPTGVNRWDEQWEAGAYNALGNPVTGSNQIRSKNLIPVEPETEYYFYIDANINCRIYFCRENGSVISYSAYNKATFTTPAECKWLKFHTGSGYGETYTEKISINFPATETGYEPFETETSISFPSPVYGGTLDVVSGVLTVEWGYILLDGSQTPSSVSNARTETIMVSFPYALTKNTQSWKDVKTVCDRRKFATYTNSAFYNVDDYLISFNGGVVTGIQLKCPAADVTDVASAVSYLQDNPLQVAYTLETPITYQLTQEQITAIVGDNTIWSDADGSMTAVYLKKG